jgi:hypothetical protein
VLRRLLRRQADAAGPGAAGRAALGPAPQHVATQHFPMGRQ